VHSGRRDAQPATTGPRALSTGSVGTGIQAYEFSRRCWSTCCGAPRMADTIAHPEWLQAPLREASPDDLTRHTGRSDSTPKGTNSSDAKARSRSSPARPAHRQGDRAEFASQGAQIAVAGPDGRRRTSGGRDEKTGSKAIGVAVTSTTRSRRRVKGVGGASGQRRYPDQPSGIQIVHRVGRSSSRNEKMLAIISTGRFEHRAAPSR